ncbi:MAG: hypothetical protein IJL06_03315 [Kiritimatiellae bacterium]|nr:hypothetical protein [Kiritimatiellia bacterium]
MKPILPILLAALFAAAPASAWQTNKVSSVEHSTFYRGGGSTKGTAGLSGGDYSDSLFNGTFTDYRWQNTAGAYLVVDLDDTFPNGCYVTEVKTGHKGGKAYSLYSSADGSKWDPIAEQITAAGERTFTLEKVVKKVKVVWDQADWSQQTLAEIEVWGADPSEVGCVHPDEYVTEWEAIPASATCTEYGIDQRQCTLCGEFFYRESLSALPNGHEYETVLVERGTSLAFGSGTNVCRTCGNAIVFDEPVDLATLGGAYNEGLVQFTDVTVSSIWRPQDGAGGAGHLVDGKWQTGYNAGWMAGSLNHDEEYAQFDFANVIDLTAVEISVHNHDQVVEFYSVEGGEEVLIGNWVVEKNTAANAADYQRETIEFRGVSLSTLRVRVLDTIGISLWNKQIISICECHPYGTVNGAGKSAAVRTRIIID